MEIYYENSKKKKISLSEWPIAIDDVTPLFAKKWEYELNEFRLKNKSELEQMYRTTASIKLKIQIFADSREEFEQITNDFQEITEIDVLTGTEGKLWCNGYYMPCFIVADEAQDYEEDFYTVDSSIEILSINPFWYKEQTKQFLPGTTSEDTDGLDFPFDFEFDFAADQAGVAHWEIDHYTSSHFLMHIYGPCENPRILVNGYPYQVFTSLASGDYLEINSRKNTVIKYLANGTTENCYNSRLFYPRIFEKIPSGALTFNWSGAFGFDVVLYIERSEPKWS